MLSTPLLGYHQKCHTPPIPASALELDTPWNCTYCLRGVKCPYLTESLDVLQNLLSDEESQSHDDVDSVTTIESDEGGEEFAAVQQQQQQQQQQYGRFLTPPKPQKKRVSFYKSNFIVPVQDLTAVQFNKSRIAYIFLYLYIFFSNLRNLEFWLASTMPSMGNLRVILV